MRSESHALIAGELTIVWCGHPPAFYDYVREGVLECNFRQRFPKKGIDPGKNTDGGPLSHLVAYAILKADAKSVNHGYQRYHTFPRRYWWVKQYDRWKGCGTHNGGWYVHGAPCEAVLVPSIVAGYPTTKWSYEKGPTNLWLPNPDTRKAGASLNRR